VATHGLRIANIFEFASAARVAPDETEAIAKQSGTGLPASTLMIAQNERPLA
jgi:hypothetical protein